MVTCVRKHPKGLCTLCGVPIENENGRNCENCKKERKKSYIETRRSLFIKEQKTKKGKRICLCCEEEFMSDDVLTNRLCKACSSREDTYEMHGVYL